MLYYSIVMVSIGSLIVQGLLHSVPSLQVSVAMPYYSIVMVSIDPLGVKTESHYFQ